MKKIGMIVILAALIQGAELYAQPTKEIVCGRDTCTSNFIPEDNFDKVFHSSFILGNENEEENVLVKAEDGQVPRSLRLNVDSSSFEKPASLDIQFQATSSEYNAADTLVIGDTFDDLLVNLNGFSPSMGRSASQVCADYVKRGVYGELAKLEFETARLLSQQEGGSIPEDRCVYSDVQNIQKRAFDTFRCGGDDTFTILGTNDPLVSVRRLKGKNKCLGVAFQDICLAPMVEVTCTWKLKYASTQSAIDDVLVFSNDRSDLANALAPYVPPTMTQIFSTWARFDGGAYFHPAGTTISGHSQARSWTSTATYVQSTVNSSNTIGFISAQQFDKYTHEVTVSSGGGDDDGIGVILAFTRENNKNHFLKVSRNAGGIDGSQNWTLVYGDGSTSREGAATYNKEKRIILQGKTIDSRPMAWNGRSSKIKVERDGDIFRAWTTRWNSGTYEATSIFQIDLNLYPELWKFKGKKPYGYFAYSQDRARFTNISFKGGLQTARIVDAQEDKVYDYDPQTGLYYLRDSSAILANIQNAPNSLGNVTINSGQTVELIAGNTYVYDSLTIREGGVLKLGQSNVQNISKIIVKGNLVVDGIIDGQGSANYIGDSYTEFFPLTNKNYSISVGQSAGGAGGNFEEYFGGEQNSGHGGGGAQGDLPCKPETGKDGISATLEFPGAGLPNNNESGTCGVGVGASGKGGARGKHGQSLLLIVLGNIEGEGQIDLSGGEGEDGSNGLASGQGGSGGGGGAGGSSGILFIETDGVLSPELELSTFGGSGGNGGSGGISSAGTDNGYEGEQGESGLNGRVTVQKINTSVAGLYGTEREIINFMNGRRYWINQDGTIVDSKVGEYSSEESESESKKFLILEAEYLDKKEKGLLKYMCNNLTQDLDEPYEDQRNLVNNSTFTKDSSFWNLNGYSSWTYEKIKIEANPRYDDRIVRTGEVWKPKCNSNYTYNNLTVQPGGMIDIEPGENCIFVLNVKNKLINNGTIRGAKNTYASSFNFTSPEGEKLTINSVQQAGGKGGKGTAPNSRGNGRMIGDGGAGAYGNGGGGGGGDATDKGCSWGDSGLPGSAATKNQAGTGGTGGDRGGNAPAGPSGWDTNGNGLSGTYSVSTCEGAGGKGGSGGFRGMSGHNAYFYAPIFEGNGIWDFAGRNGGAGASGSPGVSRGWRVGGYGGAGGGGAGGNGGKVFFRYDYVFSSNFSIRVNGGQGGISGPQHTVARGVNGANGLNGFADIKATGKTPDLEKIATIPNATQAIQTQAGKKYRLTGVYQQSIEDPVGSAGQINIYSDINKDNKIYQYDIAPKGFINPAWIDSEPTYHHFGQVGTGGLLYTMGYIQGSTADFGCADAPHFSSPSYNLVTCDGRKGHQCVRFCYSGVCTNHPKTLFDSYIRTDPNQQYESWGYSTRDLRKGCGGNFVYGIGIYYRQYYTAPNSFKNIIIVNKEEERSAINCEPPFVGIDNHPTTTTKSPHFRIESHECTDTLEPKEECKATIKTEPTQEGTFTGYLKMICEDPKYGKKSTMITELQVTTTPNVYPKDLPVRNAYPIEAKPVLLDDSGASDDVYMYYKSCNDLLKNGGENTSGRYIIDPDGKNGPIQPFPVYCDMINDGGGWTLVAKVATNTGLWSYQSPYWTDDNLFNENDVDIDANTNMKNRAFTSLDVKDVRMCMINTENCLNITVNKPNAKTLFTQDTAIEAPGRFDIMNISQQPYSEWDNQPNCNARGFNRRVNGQWSISCRFGIVMNNENDCNTPDSFIGFGCYDSGTNSHIGAGTQRWSPTRHQAVRGFIWIKDEVALRPTVSTTRLREPIDFVFEATSSTTLIELRSFQREYPSYYDNIKVVEVPLNSGPTLPPAQEGLANVIGIDGPGYYDIYGEPSIERTVPTYNPEDYTTPDDSRWDMQYVKVGTQCPMYLDKIREDFVTTHVEYDPDDDKCDNIDYKYDPENKLIDWKNVGFERKPEFGFENILCALGDCPIKSNTEYHNASMSPSIIMSNELKGTQQGEGIFFTYDVKNVSASARKGENASIGVNDLPVLSEVRYCYKIQDAATEGEDSDFAVDPVVQFRQYNWQAITVDETIQIPKPTEDNGKKVKVFKKIDSSVRNLLKEELL